MLFCSVGSYILHDGALMHLSILHHYLFDGKKTTSVRGQRHKPFSLRSTFYTLYQARILYRTRHQKGNGEDTMGSKSNPKIMKANRILKNGTAQNRSKKENALDIISKLVQGVCGIKKRNNRENLL